MRLLSYNLYYCCYYPVLKAPAPLFDCRKDRESGTSLLIVIYGTHVLLSPCAIYVEHEWITSSTLVQRIAHNNLRETQLSAFST